MIAENNLVNLMVTKVAHTVLSHDVSFCLRKSEHIVYQRQVMTLHFGEGQLHEIVHKSMEFHVKGAKKIRGFLNQIF
jgi:hypothetical protein